MVTINIVIYCIPTKPLPHGLVFDIGVVLSTVNATNVAIVGVSTQVKR